MPAYNFQERFVPMILDGSKTHTIRKRRKHMPVAGDRLSLFYGMRTRHCRRLMDAACTGVRSVYIHPDGVVVYNDVLDGEEMEKVLRDPWSVLMSATDVEEIYSVRYLREADGFAWRDGFRPEGSTAEKPTGAFELMIRFWKQTHDLPFVGDMISWAPPHPPAPSSVERGRNTGGGA